MVNQTTRVKKKQQAQMKNSNQHNNLENLSRNIPCEPAIKRYRARPRKNVLTDFKNTPSETKEKRGGPRKQIIEYELPEIYTKKPSQVELGSDSDSDPEYFDYWEEIHAKNKRQKNGKKPKQFIIPQEEESENYFSTSEDEVIDIEPENEENSNNSENSCIEEIFKNENVEDTFNEQNSEINKKQQIKTRENAENYNNLEPEENCLPPESTQIQIYQANFNE